MLKKLTLLALAVAAFAIPASASAAEWKFEGEPLKETASVTLSGGAGFTAGTNGAHATLDAVIDLEPGSTGKVTTLGISNCTGTGGLTGLTCDATEENLPWTVHCNADGSVTITGVQITNHYTPSGLAPDTTLTGSVVATGEEGSLDSVSLSGSGTTVDIKGGPQGVTASVSGTLEASQAGYSCS